MSKKIKEPRNVYSRVSGEKTPSPVDYTEEPDFNQINGKLAVESEKFSQNVHLLREKLSRLSYYYEESEVPKGNGEVKDVSNTVTDLLRTQVNGLAYSNDVLEYCLRHLNSLI